MCAFKKWHQQSADFFRVSLDVGKGREQRLAQRGGSIEVTVVGAFLPGVMLEPLRGIEIRRTRGQRKHLDLPAVLRKELQDSGLLVKRRVVLD
jgi:hypothetical protein